MLSAIIDRSPSSFGFPRRLGRARKALIRISRSIRVKPACQRLFQDIAPDAARAIGPVAGLEACLNRHHHLGVMDLAGAGRTIEPGVKAGPRHIQRFVQPTDGPDEAVIRDEGEP